MVKALMCFDFFVGPSLLADTKSSIRHTRRFPANEMKKGGKVNLHIRLAFAHAKRAAKKLEPWLIWESALCAPKNTGWQRQKTSIFLFRSKILFMEVFFSRRLVSNLHSERGWRGGEGLTDGDCRLRKITNTDTEHDDDK